jgi:hypothetical protein
MISQKSCSTAVALLLMSSLSALAQEGRSGAVTLVAQGSGALYDVPVGIAAELCGVDAARLTEISGILAGAFAGSRLVVCEVTQEVAEQENLIPVQFAEAASPMADTGGAQEGDVDAAAGADAATGADAVGDAAAGADAGAGTTDAAGDAGAVAGTDTAAGADAAAGANAEAEADTTGDAAGDAAGAGTDAAGDAGADTGAGTDATGDAGAGGG